jgi:nitrogen-specific signal transduction histidine kinase
MRVAHEDPSRILDTHDFLTLVVHELKRATNHVSFDATLLDFELAREPDLREIALDIRRQADRVATLLDALSASSNESLT